jgi:Flp pilus assembly protein TadD
MFGLRSGLWLASALLPVSLLLASCAQTSTTANSNASAVGPDTLNVADAAIAGGDPNMALSVSQSVLATDANNVDALEHEGDAYYALGRCPAAEAAYQLALDHNAKATEAETGLGRCLLKTDPHEAEIAFILAVQDDPGNAAALNDLGIARDLQGNFAGAVEPYQRALLANPSLTAAEVNLGLSLALSGNGPEALQYLGPLATSQEATPKIREDYAAALLASGRASEAKQVLAVDLPPDQVVAAMAGFSTVIAQSQMPPPPVAPPAPTVSEVPTAPVITMPVTQNTAPAPSIQAAPQPLVPAAPQQMAQPAPAYVPDNSTAAYTGPSPIPVTGSSSTVPVAAPPPPAGPARSIAHTAASGGATVQLGALNTPDDAERAWRSISGDEPALFAGKEPEIEPVTASGKTFYRLRVGGFDSKVDAAKFCGEVSAAGSACTLANF